MLLPVDAARVCTECAKGEYLTAADTPGPLCSACPLHSTTTRPGAISVTECVCEEGYSGHITAPSDVCRKPEPQPNSACGDAAADNHGPGSGTPPGDNRECIYSCSTLLAHFQLSPSAGECWIDAGSARRWPPAPVDPTNNTYTVPSWTATKAVVIQGHALGRWGQGTTPLLSRVDAVGAVVLRHVNMSGLVESTAKLNIGRVIVGHLLQLAALLAFLIVLQSDLPHGGASAQRSDHVRYVMLAMFALIGFGSGNTATLLDSSRCPSR